MVIQLRSKSDPGMKRGVQRGKSAAEEKGFATVFWEDGVERRKLGDTVSLVFQMILLVTFRPRSGDFPGKQRSADLERDHIEGPILTCRSHGCE